MRYKIFVINLDRSPERLTYMTKQLNDLGLVFERFPAINIKELTQEQLGKYYSKELSHKKFHKTLNNGEIGCYLSHYFCWKKIVDENLDFALIFEDDVVIDPSIVNFIKAVESTHQDWDYIKLSQNPLRPPRAPQKNALRIGTEFLLSSYLKLSTSMCGQLVARSGAEKLLKCALPVACPVDVFIRRWYESDLDCRVISPLLVTVADFPSDIAQSGNRKKTASRPWKDICLKLSYYINLMKYGIERKMKSH